MYTSTRRTDAPTRFAAAICLPIVAICLWASPAHAKQCTQADFDRATAGKPTTSQMLSYMMQGIKDSTAGHAAAADQTWLAAYNYAREHCYPLDADGANKLLLNGEARQATVAYRQSLRVLLPQYQSTGLDKPFTTGLDAAQAGNFSAAASAFHEVLRLAKTYPQVIDYPDADFMLGVAMFAQGDHARAVEQWRATLTDRGPAEPEQENFGPDQPWLWALQLYVTLRPQPNS